MCAVQLLRVSVHERISAAAEDFLLRLEKGEEAAELPALRALLTERLTAAAEEIVGLLEETVAEYEDRVERSEREICRQRRLLEAVLKPEVRLHRADVQQLEVNDEKEKMERSGSEARNGRRGHAGKKRFCCSLCGRSFSKVAGLNYHLKIHSGEKPFSCSVCRKKFRKKGHLKYHALIHTGVKPFVCSVCNRTFRWPSQVKIHKCVRESPQRLHDKLKKPLSCSMCGEKFSDGSLLTAHRRIHQEKKKMLSCSVCGLQRQFHSQMKLHMRSHTGEKPYSCSHCPKKFARKAMLTQHTVVHSKVKPLGCIDCGKRFCWNFQIKKHKCPAKPSAVDGLSRRSTYIKSKASVDPDDSDGDFWRKTRKHWSGFTYNRNKTDRGFNTEEKPLSCPDEKNNAERKLEGKDSPSALTSEKHNRVSETLNGKNPKHQLPHAEDLSKRTAFHSEIQKEVKQEEPEPTNIKEEQEETDVTKFTFSSVPMKTEEEEEKHQSSPLQKGRSVETPEPGSQPDDGTSDRSETDVSDGGWEETSDARRDPNGPVVPERRIDEKAFVCPVCGKIFGRKGNLETHLRTHTGERPFGCPLCNKTFTTKLIMKMHMSVHTGEKRFTCQVCGKKFNWHSQIKYHKCVQNQPAEPDLRLEETSEKTDDKDAESGSNSDDESEDGEVFTQSKRLQSNCQKHEDSERQKAPEDRNTQQTHLRHSTTEKPFSCSFCGKGFATGGHLTRHTSIHTGEKLLGCFICDKTFSEESELLSHQCVGESSQRQTEEQITASKTFVCSVCAERFSRLEDLSFHFRRHPRCSVCDAGFSDRDSLVQHMRSHTRQTQFLCSVCGKDFAWRRHLTKHMEDHAKKKLYRCTVCRRKFTCPKKHGRHRCVGRSSQLHHSSSDEHVEEDGGPEPEPEPQPEDKTAESSDPDTDDSDCWKENRGARFTSEKCHRVPEIDSTLHRNTRKRHRTAQISIQQLPYEDDLSRPVELRTDEQREVKQEELVSRDIKEEQEELVSTDIKEEQEELVSTDIKEEQEELVSTEIKEEQEELVSRDIKEEQEELVSRDIKEEQEELVSTDIKEEQEDTDITLFTSSFIPMKTEDDEEKPQFSRVHQGDSVGEPEPDPDPDSDGGGVCFSDESVDSDFWKDSRLRRSGHESGRNPFSSSEETKLQLESDDSNDSDFWKDHRNPPSGSDSVKHGEASDNEASRDAERKPYSCTECGKTFHYIFHMKTHMKLHTEERPFFCSVCGQKCLYKSHLKIHMRTHTGEKPFGCPVCGKKYAHKASMQAHMSEHARRYSCSVCGRRFAWYTELKYHQCGRTSSHKQTYRGETT